MIRNHPEAIAIIAILLTMPCAYMLGSASREVRSTIAPIHRELGRELGRELRQELRREKDKIRGEGQRLRLERDRMRHELRDEIRRALRFRSV
jgi:hypothetical protein